MQVICAALRAARQVQWDRYVKRLGSWLLGGHDGNPMTTFATTAWWLTLLLLVVGSIAILRLRYQADWKWFLFGIFSYLIGILVKGLIFTACPEGGLSTLPAFGQAAITGILSAMTELSAAAAFLWRRTVIPCQTHWTAIDRTRNGRWL